MVYGLTANGFLPMPMDVIRGEIVEETRSILGADVRDDDQSVNGVVTSIVAEREALLWDQLEQVYQSAYRAGARGAALDDLYALSGGRRAAATYSTVALLCGGSAGTLLPIGATAKDKRTKALWVLTQSGSIVVRLSVGGNGNGAYVITFAGTAIAPSFNASGHTVTQIRDGLLAALVSNAVALGLTSLPVGTDQIEISATAPGTLFALGGLLSPGSVLTGAPVPITLSASPVDPGATNALAGDIAIRQTNVAGWTTVINPLDAVPGHDAETDSSVRQKMLSGPTVGLGSSTAHIRNALRDTSGVLDVIIMSNRDWVPDADGLPPKSFEAVVRGGLDATIANVIWLGHPAGIQSVGSTSVVIVDADGDPQTIRFTRPTDIPVYFDIRVAAYPGFPLDGLNTIKAIILDYGSTLRDGQPVVPFHILQRIELPNIYTVEIYLGRAASPSNTGPLKFTKRERAAFQSANIALSYIPVPT